MSGVSSSGRQHKWRAGLLVGLETNHRRGQSTWTETIRGRLLKIHVRGVSYVPTAIVVDSVPMARVKCPRVTAFAGIIFYNTESQSTQRNRRPQPLCVLSVSVFQLRPRIPRRGIRDGDRAFPEITAIDLITDRDRALGRRLSAAVSYKSTSARCLMSPWPSS